MGRHGTGGLFEANPSASSSPNTGEEDEPDVKTETLQEVKNPYDAVDPTTALAPDLATVKKELSSLPVKERASKNGYSREQFGAAWEDVDKNGCNTRDDILRRDLTDVRFKAGTRACTVITGKLADPYTGKTIDFKRGKKTSSAVQIDHVVALSDAWQKGAQNLSAVDREKLANDPLNLLASEGQANQNKGDSDASAWLPPNKDFRCQYVARQIAVKKKYHLWVTDAEKQASAHVLEKCKG